MFTKGTRLYLVDFETTGTVSRTTRHYIHFTLDRPVLPPDSPTFTTEVTYPKTSDPSAFLPSDPRTPARKAWATRRSDPLFDPSASARKAWATRRTRQATN